MDQDFYRERKKILNKENEEYLGADLLLTTSEKIANGYLMRYKRKEIMDVFNDHNTSNPAVFPPSQNFLISKQLILKSEVYKFIANMPKGSNENLLLHFVNSFKNILMMLTLIAYL